MWGPDVRLTVLLQSRYYIVARIDPANRPSWVLVCVYGDASYRDNPCIWHDNKGVIEAFHVVCCVGDFNAISESGEKFGGNSTLNRNSRLFRDFIFDNGLVDLGFKGPAFTWTNKPHASEGVHVRLDRVLATAPWCNLYRDSYVNHIHRLHSDHAPILLRTMAQKKRQKLFRVENWWLQRDDFSKLCEEEWNKTRGLGWVDRQRSLKGAILAWNSNLSTPQKEVARLQKLILEFQSLHPSQQNSVVEEDLMHQYDLAEEALDAYWRQRSRVQWTQLGDRNMAFYHAVATQRRRRNNIVLVTNEMGDRFTDEKLVAREFVSNYRNLYKSFISLSESQLDDFFQSLEVSPESCIPDWAKQSLVKVPTLKEVKETLEMMGPDKASDPDGLIGCFIL